MPSLLKTQEIGPRSREDQSSEKGEKNRLKDLLTKEREEPRIGVKGGTETSDTNFGDSEIVHFVSIDCVHSISVFAIFVQNFMFRHILRLLVVNAKHCR